MDKVLEELEASDFRLDWSIEELQNGYYLVTHEVLIQ
jgi:exonuclease VII small subunit